jgi:hypothetical protein
MSQTATFIRINEKEFSQLPGLPDDMNLSDIAKEEITLQGTHEGIRFILSKSDDDETAILTDQIFYPDTFLGEENIESLMNGGNEPVYYNEPAKVAAIASVLQKIGTDDFMALYDYEELNENDIYPAGNWNDNAERNSAFNEDHITQEFILLKDFFINAKKEGDYVLIFIG